MALQIYRLINSPISSNCFVVFDEGSDNCIIIDPGSADSTELLNYLYEKKLKPEYILLTHEHFDHIWGVNTLKQLYNSTIICSTFCSERITDRKKNMSVFYEYPGFECPEAEITFQEEYDLFWNNKTIKLIYTPGHSSGSICIRLENILFSGDTIIPGEKTVTKFPTGNQDALKSTKELLSSILRYPIIMFPGHGEQFLISDKQKFIEL
jgi:glyoxylase-like metal-dependent hydrolase (beta-lactamase superfamily II)